MSVVTGITIISQSFKFNCDEINNWLNDKGFGSLIEVSKHYGGGKHPEILVYGGGYNHFPWEEFLAFMEDVEWEKLLYLPEEQRVVIVVSPDQHPAITLVFP